MENKIVGKPSGRAWSYIPLTNEVGDKLRVLMASVPKDWQTDHHGKQFTSNHSPFYHITFLTRIDESAKNFSMFKQLVANEKEFTIDFGPLFLQRVDRITSSEVWCIGLPIEPHVHNIISLRDKCEKSLKKVKIGYRESPGHISLAYIKKEFYEQAKQWVADTNAKNTTKTISFQVNAIACSGAKKVELFSLG
eukprot:TRINITY_DN4057_c0_g1_i1.p1 TRINITY_DN4057_c0_g1~~TRINITY_DN4057_c0_g1_i1.p1  ORF type:complete len:193 (+),score=28.03 TRINITY_DN4057_c0_g1_i1:54-632(+)